MLKTHVSDDKFSFEGMKMNKFLNRNYGPNQTVEIYNKQNGKLFCPQNGVRNHHNKTQKMNKKIMDNYCNENLDTRQQFHKKVPAALYDKAMQSELAFKIENVKNNSVQKYMD